jgi:hypothetical protein
MPGFDVSTMKYQNPDGPEAWGFFG